MVTECARVRDTAAALAVDDLAGAGALLTASHRSLADDFDVSTPVLDELVAALVSRRGVFGARMTGAGFGGCVVALTRPGAVDPDGMADAGLAGARPRTARWPALASDGRGTVRWTDTSGAGGSGAGPAARCPGRNPGGQPYPSRPGPRSRAAAGG